MSEGCWGQLNRRDLLRVASSAVVGSAFADLVRAEGRPAVTQPRATSGDQAVEPKWAQRLTMTVGPKEGDLVGGTDKVIQAAVDYVFRLGGGTVHVLPGTYRLRNSIFLRSGVRLLGSGEESVLVKCPSVETTLAADSDWYDQEITLADAKGFEVGDGVCLQTDNPHHGGKDILKRTLVARDGNRFKLDRPLRENFWVMKRPTATTLFPLLTAENTGDFVIENVALDGDRKNNAHLDGNYAGCIWLQDCSRIVMRGVTARNYNGDGISFQVCHDVVAEGCHCHDNADLGMHPGSGSQRPVMRGNRLERNTIGLFFCWGVQYGLAEKNTIVENRSFGVSIGHRDSGNVVRGNEILRSGHIGVLFRPERGESFAPHGNVLEANRIVDSGKETGVGIDLKGESVSTTIARNEVRETRGPASRIGVRIGPQTRGVTLIDNTIEGFAKAIADERKA